MDRVMQWPGLAIVSYVVCMLLVVHMSVPIRLGQVIYVRRCLLCAWHKAAGNVSHVKYRAQKKSVIFGTVCIGDVHILMVHV